MILALLLVLQVESGKPVPKETKAAIEVYASVEAYRDYVAKLTAEGWARIAYMQHAGPVNQLKAERAIAARKAAEAAGVVARLPQGFPVDVSSNPGPCSVPSSDKATPVMARVRVPSGKDEGTIGCVVASLLRDPVPF